MLLNLFAVFAIWRVNWILTFNWDKDRLIFSGSYLFYPDHTCSIRSIKDRLIFSGSYLFYPEVTRYFVTNSCFSVIHITESVCLLLVHCSRYPQLNGFSCEKFVIDVIEHRCRSRQFRALGAIFARIFRQFAQIFKDFAEIFTDFSRIFDKSKLLGVQLHPWLLHHCNRSFNTDPWILISNEKLNAFESLHQVIFQFQIKFLRCLNWTQNYSFQRGPQNVEFTDD